MHAGRQTLADGRLEDPAAVRGGAAVRAHGHALSSLHVRPHQGTTPMALGKISMSCVAPYVCAARVRPQKQCCCEESPLRATCRSPGPNVSDKEVLVQCRWSCPMCPGSALAEAHGAPWADVHTDHLPARAARGQLGDHRLVSCWSACGGYACSSIREGADA